MAGFLSKINRVWSGADFWDKKENQRQREQFAREDEEERRRKEAARQAAQQRTTVSTTRPDLPSLLVKPEERRADPSKPASGGFVGDFTAPQKARDIRSETQKELDRLKAEEMPKSLAQEKRNTSWLSRTFTDRNWDERAEANAINKATRRFQDKNGYNRDVEVLMANDKSKRILEKSRKDSASKVVAPVLSTARVGTGLVQGAAGTYDLLTPGKGQNRLTKSSTKKAEEIDQLAKDLDVDGLYKTGNVVGEVATFFSPGLLTKAGKAGQFTSGIGDNISNRIGDSTKLRKFGSEVVDDLSDIRNIEQEIRLGMRYLGQESARGEDIGAGDIASEGALGFGAAFLPPTVRRLLKKVSGNSAVDEATIAATGAAVNRASNAIEAEKPKIPGKVDVPATEVEPQPPTITVDSGIKSTNIPTKQTPAPAVVESTPDTTPAYENRAPKTVGDAQAQNDMGLDNIDDTLFDADARLKEQGSPVPEDTALDIPTYLRRQAEEGEQGLVARLSELDQRIADIERRNSRSGRIDDQQAVAAAYRISPQEGLKAKRELEYRQNNINNPEILKTLNIQRQQLVRELNNVREAQAANATLAAPAPEVAPVQAPEQFSEIVPAKAPMTAPDAPLQPAPVMADFTQSIQVAPQKAPVDNMGNPVVRTDAQTARQVQDEYNVAPTPAPSPLRLAEDEMEEQAQRLAREQVVETPSDIKAPRTAAQILSGENEADLQQIFDSLNIKNTVNIAKTSNAASQRINSADINDVVARYALNNGKRTQETIGLQLDQPEAFFEAIAAADRLKGVDAPGVADAKITLYNAILDKVSESGLNLRFAREFWDSMPAEYKTESLLRKMAKAGVDDVDAVRQQLLDLVTAADNAAEVTRNVRNQLDEIAQGLETGRIADTPQVRARAEELVAQENALIRQQEYSRGYVRDFVDSRLPENSGGQKAANVARISMLSSILGRAYDLTATTTVAGGDNAVSAVSALAGKALNKKYGAGAAIDTLPSLTRQFKGVKEGLSDTSRHTFAGDRRVPLDSDVLQKGPVRSEIQPNKNYSWDNPLKKLGNAAKNWVTGTVEGTTNLTSGLKKDRQYQLAVQQAKQRGVPEDSIDLYAQTIMNSPRAVNQIEAAQYHLRTNNLHRNALGTGINAMFKSWENALKSSPVGRNVYPLIESNLLPFKSWAMGNISRAATDANMIHNASMLGVSINRGDAQGVADAIGKLTVNGGIFTAGYLLSNSGLVVSEDANGNSYAGKYFDINGMRIPVAVLGPYAVPFIFGANTEEAGRDGGGIGDYIEDVIGKSVFDSMKSVGATSTLGGSNTVMSALQTAGQEGAELDDVAPNLVRGAVGQYIPSAFGDVNSVIDMTPANPTGENAETKVMVENEDGREVKDNWASMGNQLKDRIPGWSQTLPRKSGEAAQNVFDRLLRATRETGEAKQERLADESLEDRKLALEKEGIPTTAEKIEDFASVGDYEKALRGSEYRLAAMEADEDASEADKALLREKIAGYTFGNEYGYVPTKSNLKPIEARIERGEYGAAKAGKEFLLERMRNDDNVPQSDVRAYESDVKRLSVYEEMDIDPGFVTAYEAGTKKTGGVLLEAWRDMMESGDEELVAYANQLYDLDKALLDAGAIKEQKYYWNASGKGSRGGGRGSSKLSGTASFASFTPGGEGYAPMKAQAATMQAPQSVIPTLEKAPVNDRSMLKKISVTRGGR